MDLACADELVERDDLIWAGNFFKRELPGLSDLQVLSFLEACWLLHVYDVLDDDCPQRLTGIQLLEVPFQDFRDEILAEPPTLAFKGLPSTAPEGPPDPFAERFTSAITRWKAARASRINAANTSRAASTTSVENHPIMPKTRPEAASGSSKQAPPVNTSSRGSAVPDKARKVNIMDGSNAKAQAESSGSSPTAHPGTMLDTNPKAQDPEVSQPTEEDECPARSWVFPKADVVLDKAQIQYDMMYEIVTQMQRERLSLPATMTDYEVIAQAHASYTVSSADEAAALARAATTQQTTALSRTLLDELKSAEIAGGPISTIGGLELTQPDIVELISRCEQVGHSGSALKDVVEFKTGHPSFEEAILDDYRTDGSAGLAGPADVAELIALVALGAADRAAGLRGRGGGAAAAAGAAHHTPGRAGRSGRQGRPSTAATTATAATAAATMAAATGSAPPSSPVANTIAGLVEHKDRWTTAVTSVERDLANLREFKSRIETTATRDFASEIDAIEQELRELKEHRAKYPGDPEDRVPDAVDGFGEEGYRGVRVDEDDVGQFGDVGVGAGERFRAEAAAVLRAAGAGGDQKMEGEVDKEVDREVKEQEGEGKEGKKKLSRAEQRRVARQKGKGKGKGKAVE